MVTDKSKKSLNVHLPHIIILLNLGILRDGELSYRDNKSHIYTQEYTYVTSLIHFNILSQIYLCYSLYDIYEDIVF